MERIRDGGPALHGGQPVNRPERRQVASSATHLVDQTRALQMGVGADPKAQIGPVINRSQLERIHGYVEDRGGRGRESL